MRKVNDLILSGADSQLVNSIQVDANQLISCSIQANFGDTQAAGTVKLQMSNDVFQPGGQSSNFTVSHWTDIPSATVSVASGASAMLLVPVLAYRWLRAVWTPTTTGAQTIAPIADTGRKQVQTVSTVADVAGSLNSTYFLLSSKNVVSKAQKNFYMWFDDGAGVDPAIAGRTAIHITYSAGDSANTLATSMRTALNALTNDFVATGATNAVIITDAAFGPVTAAVDSVPAPTGFAFGATTVGLASNLNNTYFLLQDEGSVHSYFVWINVDNIGTSPAIAGRTSVPIAISSGATAATIGSALATAIAALNSAASFSTSGTTTVAVTNLVAGPFVAMSDGAVPTHFTFAITAGGSTTVSVNLFGMSV